MCVYIYRYGISTQRYMCMCIYIYTYFLTFDKHFFACQKSSASGCFKNI